MRISLYNVVLSETDQFRDSRWAILWTRWSEPLEVTHHNGVENRSTHGPGSSNDSVSMTLGRGESQRSIRLRAEYS